MDNVETFLIFLESLKTNHNSSLIESIHKGVLVCFEGMVEYVAIDPFMNKKKSYGKLTEDIPLRYFDKEESLSQIIEKWSKREPSDNQLEFLISKRPQIIFDGRNIINLTNHKGWDSLRKFANNIYADRIENIKRIKQQDAEMSNRNIMRSKKLKGEMSNKLIKQNELTNKHKYNRHVRGLSSTKDLINQDELKKQKEKEFLDNKLKEFMQSERVAV